MSSNSYIRIASITLYVLFAIGVIFGVLFYVGGNVPGTSETGYPEPVITSNALYLSYIYFIITAVLAVVLPLIFTSKRGGSKSMTIASIIFIAIMIISYLIAPGSPMKGIDMSKIAMKFIDGGLISTYFLLGIAFLGIVYSEASSFFK